ncbi:MAG: polyprenyl synthetase family protein, partial [Prevotellamassilia sp.]|nr:polyprenyl synthetase family protein [Prevotellamassilia sp.]
MLNQIEQFIDNIVFPEKPEGLYEPITYSLEMGGKRIRPVLTLLSHSLYAPCNDDTLRAAVAIEMYHNHTLLHDDLMDGAEVRRGKPAVHRRWNANTAILSGDTMLIESFKLINACQCQRADEARRLFIDTTIEVCEGQQYDMNFEQRTDVTEAEYLEMIRLKTSVLLACAAKMGG